jgi:geranylgeranyl diphosphate synthase type I
MTVSTTTTLTSGRALVHPALQDAVSRLDDHTRRVAGYHLGWLDQGGRPVDGPEGKALRPVLALLSAQAAGASVEVGLPGAVAVELVHNFSLLHDDVMDGDAERRHRRTVWSVWGESTAILAGDALLSLAHEVILESPSPQAAQASRLLATATRELVRGQVEDLAFETRSRVTVSECIDMAAGKTGALLAASAAIGAVLAAAEEPVIEALSTYGGQLGIAFQLVDDLLGIWGHPVTTGKPVHSDLRSRKKTLPIAYATEHGGAVGRELLAWLAEPQRADDEARLSQGAELVERGGGRAWAQQEAERRLALALKAIQAVDLPDQVTDELISLGNFVVGRDA